MSDGTIALAFVIMLAILVLVACIAVARQFATVRQRIDVLGSQLIDLKIERAGRVRRPMHTALKRGQRATAIMTYTKMH